MSLCVQVRYYMSHVVYHHQMQPKCLGSALQEQRQSNERTSSGHHQSAKPKSRWQRAAVARETLEVLREGSYHLNGEKTDIASVLDRARNRTILYPASQIMMNSASQGSNYDSFSIEVTQETTVQAGLRVSTELGCDSQRPVCLLNFASAKNPGGGFEGGSLAQEESLACSSGLYACLLPHMSDFYTPHRKDPKDGFYSHAMLYSPEVPFFRDSDSAFCPLWTADVITAPAPNAGVVMRKHSKAELVGVLQERISRILHLAEEQGSTHLILGAYGCGVFKNEPEDVAAAFAKYLQGVDKIGNGVFKRITFAIPGGEEDHNFKVFHNYFGQGKARAPASELEGRHELPQRRAPTPCRSEVEPCNTLKNRQRREGGRGRKDAHLRKYAEFKEFEE
eukprot:gnl/MRDRNA2_/MRDRNA2_87716_c0_seq1.p1 gnl/MRDRNA2_/MRDRNA2_87716_c0~~gnl/MRDRNA2_/MRDRNA2_87716_c0_seq1.p1  ORF type:complete len:393 (-),score=59.95 gnl/MRDRNA2_/MRDRNA2_87716_c0_seq1:71-1249(-)